MAKRPDVHEARVEEPERDPFDGKGPFKKWATWLKGPGELQASVARAIGKTLTACIREGSIHMDYIEEHFVMTVPKARVEQILGRRIP